MLGPICVTITPAIERVAEQLGKSPALTAAIVSAWMSENQSAEYPSVETLSEYAKNRRPLNEKSIKDTQNSDYTRLLRDFPPAIRKFRAVSIARMFTDIVSRGVEEKLSEINDAISKETDPANLGALLDKKREYEDVDGRHAVIRDMTLKNIFDQIRDKFESYLEVSEEEYDEDYGEGMGAYMLREYQKIIDNFPALLDEACSIIEGAESVRIVTNYHEFNNGDVVEQVLGGEMMETTDEAETEEEQFNDDEEGNRATGNGGWSFQVRFVDPYSSLSKDVKRVLSNIKRVDASGQIETDDLANVMYLDSAYAHTVLLNELSSMADPDDFSIRNSDGSWSFPALEQAAVKYPWINQVIQELSTNESLIGSFYADLRKDFIPYWHQFINDEGVQVPHALNQNTALESTFNQFRSNYEQKNLLDADSLYNRAGNIDSSKSDIGISLCDDVLRLLREFDEDDYAEITKKVAKGLRMLGLDANPAIIGNLIQTSEGINSIETVANAMRRIFSEAKEVDSEVNLIEQFNEDYRLISEKVGVVSELDNIASFRQGDKTRYSYSAPNYVDSMIKFIKSDSRRAEYLESEFGQYEWFKKNGKWRSGWLSLFSDESDLGEIVRHHLSTKELVDLNGVEYTNWVPSMIRKGFINEYFSCGINAGSKVQFAYYNMPIFSDSPVVKFIKCVRYTGDFKSQITPLLRDVIRQEINRINLVRERRKAGVNTIQNFDKNGDRFHFFPELNDGTFIQQIDALMDNRDAKGINQLIDTKVNEIMNNLFRTFMRNSANDIDDIADNLVKLGVITAPEQVNDALEEYFWNQAYATTQIIELTTTDLAFYRDDVDFQKRYKEVYAAGIKLNTNTKYGKKFRRSVYLADQIVTSNSFSNIKAVLDKAVALGHITSTDRASILNKFKDINVADAQAYLSPQSMRSVLDMMGKWTDAMEASMQRFEEGKWDMADFNTLWQTIKPFVYTQIPKPDGFGKMIKVPHQNKNSEFLLLAAYQTIATSLGRSPKLRALQKFMRDNDIDVIQFQSAVKAGGQGIVNINYSDSKLNDYLRSNPLPGQEGTFENLKKHLDRQLEQGRISQDEYNSIMESLEPSEQEVYLILEKYTKVNGSLNPEVVHEIPYRDYVIQQPTPEHLIDSKAVFGSQLRNLIIADLPEGFSLTLDGKTYNRDQVVDLYVANIVENLLDDYGRVAEEFSDIHSLQEALLGQVKSNVKFSKDMIDALQIVQVSDNNGTRLTFNAPLSNPSTTLKLQEIITSMFKNAVTKQSIKGGSAILVSNFGLTDELEIEYGKEGNISGIQCYLPATSRQFYAPFMEEQSDGSFKLDFSKLPKDLRRLVGYRIPTEDKYSMAPLIVKGFLPQQNGSSIMLPADITQIAGSDFDIDKMFLMIPEFKTVRYDYRRAREDYRKIITDEPTIKLISALFQDNENLEASLEEAPNDFKEWFREHKEDYEYDTPKIRKVKYDLTKSPQQNSRAQRNNLLIDIIYGILTNPDTAEKILNPGNFDVAKLQARITQVITDRAKFEAFKEKYGIKTTEDAVSKILEISKSRSLDEINKFLDDYKKQHNTTRSQLTLDTFIYNHTQNMTGGALIGMYANNTTMQAKFQHSGLALKDDFTFMINGRIIQSLHDVTSELGERISRNCAQFSAASVDNVKDPVLADLMQNTNTARITGFMLRAGMSLEEISLMFAQPIVRRCILKDGSLRSLGKAIRQELKYLKSLGGGIDKNFRLNDFTSEDLLANVLNEYELDELSEQVSSLDYDSSTAARLRMIDILSSQLQAAMLMQHITKLASDLSGLTQIARADSPNGAIHNTIAGAKVQVAKVNRYMQRSKSKQFSITGIEDAMQNGYITSDMTVDEMRERLLKRQMPMLQAFYSLGIELGTQVLSRYFPQINEYSDAMLDNMFDHAPVSFLSSQNSAMKVVNSFYKDLVNFALSGTKTFGDDESMSFEEKRDYYLTEYPDIFLAQKAKNPEIAKLGLFKKLTVRDGVISMPRSNGMKQQARDSFMRDMESLLYMGEDAQKMAADLFMYSFYKDGFWFGPNSFGGFFSTNFINHFPEVVSTLRNINSSMRNQEVWDRFMPQFYANHANDGIVPSVDVESVKMQREGDEDKMFVPVELSSNKTTGVGHYKYIMCDDVLYHFTSANDDAYAVYRPVVTLNTLKYNANMSVDEMKAYDSEKKIEDELAGLEDALNERPMESYQEESDLDTAPQASNEPMDTSLEDLGMNLDELNEAFSEAEGEATLKQPLCK